MKKLIVLCLLLLLSGCGVPAGEAGADGASGANGSDGRDYKTPVFRPYTWDTTNTVVNFDDVHAGQLKVSQVAFSMDNNNNYVMIRIPTDSLGKKIRVVLNGNESVEVTVPDNNSHNLVFYTIAGTDYDWGKYLCCSRLNRDDRYSYFAWYLDGVQQEFYFSDSFE